MTQHTDNKPVNVLYTSPNIMNMKVIAFVKSPLKEKFGTPRQPNLVPTVSDVVFCNEFADADAVKCLEKFSHIWLIWQFHLIADDAFRPLIRPPRLGGNEKIGVFASRSMFRPNKIGMSVVELVDVITDTNNVTLKIRGADLVDGTPILDIKPYIRYSDSISHASSGYAQSAPVTAKVRWHEQSLRALKDFIEAHEFTQQDKENITALIGLDPRPAYKKTKNENGKKYHMRYGACDVHFCVLDDGFEVVDLVAVMTTSNDTTQA